MTGTGPVVARRSPRQRDRTIAREEEVRVAFEDIAVVDVRVEPVTPADSFRFQFVLSRTPERFWPECFTSAYNVQTGLRRIELSEGIVQITLPEAEAETYADVVKRTVARANTDYRAEMTRRTAEQQQRLDVEQQRQARAEELRRKAKHSLGI
jgi:hypothetical protein